MFWGGYLSRQPLWGERLTTSKQPSAWLISNTALSQSSASMEGNRSKERLKPRTRAKRQRGEICVFPTAGKPAGTPQASQSQLPTQLDCGCKQELTVNVCQLVRVKPSSPWYPSPRQRLFWEGDNTCGPGEESWCHTRLAHQPHRTGLTHGLHTSPTQD